MNDADRYIWLLMHMGLVEEEAQRWQPNKDKPLLIHLHEYITQQAEREDPKTFEAQRKILNHP